MPYSNKISIKINWYSRFTGYFLQISLTPEHIISVITEIIVPGVYMVWTRVGLLCFSRGGGCERELLILGGSDCGSHFVTFYHDVKNYMWRNCGSYFRKIVADQNLIWWGPNLNSSSKTQMIVYMMFISTFINISHQPYTYT